MDQSVSTTEESSLTLRICLGEAVEAGNRRPARRSAFGRTMSHTVRWLGITILLYLTTVAQQGCTELALPESSLFWKAEPAGGASLSGTPPRLVWWSRREAAKPATDRSTSQRLNSRLSSVVLPAKI
ncbi:unnamed protein product, partial [Protopolystoma xenopodis]